MPRHANAGRRRLFRAYLGSRPAVFAYLLGGGGAFLYGAYHQNGLLMTAVPAGVVALVTLSAAVIADRAAAQRFFRELAPSLGLFYVGHTALLPLTPLLGAGSRQWCEHWMQGVVSPEYGLVGGLGHFVYEVRTKRRRVNCMPDQLTLERQTITLALVEAEASLARFKGVFLRPRRGLFAGEDWLRGRGRPVDLESGSFSERYELLIADDQSEGVVRELFAPSLVDWLARHPLVPGLELKAGTLVVFVQRRLEEAGEIEFFLDAVRHLVGPIVEEVVEAAERPRSSR